jgi:ligand-binding sensor domain-containing protein
MHFLGASVPTGATFISIWFLPLSQDTQPESFKTSKLRRLDLIPLRLSWTALIGLTLSVVEISISQPTFWQQSEDLKSGNVIALANSSKQYLFAGIEGAGVMRGAANGDGWTPKNNGLTSTLVRCFAFTDRGDIFAGTGAGVFYSSNNAETWELRNFGLGDYVANALIVNSSGSIFAGLNGGGVYRSENNGVSWTFANNGLVSNVVLSLAIDNSGRLFAGTEFDGVFRSIDNGNNWAKLGDGLTQPDVNALAFDMGGDLFAATDGGVFILPRNADSWIRADSGLTDKRIRALAINARGHVFAGTYISGVFRSTDHGQNWVEVNSGLLNSLVRSLSVNNDGYLFAGTQGSGVFRSIGTTTSVRETSDRKPPSFFLAQNFPNPFNAGTVIAYEIPHDARVELKIYDLLGREVATLVNEQRTAGTHRVAWRSEGTASGLYLYELRVGQMSEIKKLLLLK